MACYRNDIELGAYLIACAPFGGAHLAQAALGKEAGVTGVAAPLARQLAHCVRQGRLHMFAVDTVHGNFQCGAVNGCVDVGGRVAVAGPWRSC